MGLCTTLTNNTLWQILIEWLVIIGVPALPDQAATKTIDDLMIALGLLVTMHLVYQQLG